MIFEPVVDNPDLDILEDASLPRIAVACRWKAGGTARRKWPQVGVVAPMRTLRGIDLLIRSLAANPHIRAVVLDGPDLTPGEATTQALRALWAGDAGIRAKYVGEDIPDRVVNDILEHVRLVDFVELGDTGVDPAEVLSRLPALFEKSAIPFDTDRWEDKLVLPPPKLEASGEIPIGDPGPRVSGDVLREVWPRVLEQTMRFGRTIPSQYGATREVIGLVSVIRDPIASVPHLPEWMNITLEQLVEYSRRMMEDYIPAGQEYSYGTRMTPQRPWLNMLLSDNRTSRAIYLSPWHSVPHEGAIADIERKSEQPCMVGIQFRYAGDRLHTLVNFRSHDLFGAYGLNLGAVCMWVQRLCERHKINAGPVMCVSLSAHIYEHDWVAADKVIKDQPGPWPHWDQRSTWLVDATSDGITATALTLDGSSVIERFEGRGAEGLMKKIEASGLVTEVGNALWLGQQLGLAANKRKRLRKG